MQKRAQACVSNASPTGANLRQPVEEVGRQRDLACTGHIRQNRMRNRNRVRTKILDTCDHRKLELG